MTTAQLRNAARDAASLAQWQEAADLLAAAIERHPGDRRSPLVQMDIANMQKVLSGYQAAAAA